ncbi:Fragile X mental retardation syndrome-related protein 1 [Arapaima gigas]
MEDRTNSNAKSNRTAGHGIGIPTPRSLTPSPLPLSLPSETLEVHQRPGSGDAPAKLGVLPVLDPCGIGAAADRHGGGEGTAAMDGLAVEVRGSNGAFYKRGPDSASSLAALLAPAPRR